MTVLDHRATTPPPRFARGEPPSEAPQAPPPGPPPGPPPVRDVVDAWGESSFPASDPPGWWAGA